MANAKDTGVWTAEGTKIKVQFSTKKPEIWTNWNEAIAANNGEKLSGLYLSSASAASRIFGQLNFYPDGSVDLISSKKGVKISLKRSI